MFLLRAFVTAQSFDVICQSGTYLDSFILHDNDNLKTPGYTLYSKDHPVNIKWEGGFIH